MFERVILAVVILTTTQGAWSNTSSARDAVGVGNAMWVWNTKALFESCRTKNPPVACVDAVNELLSVSREHGVHELWMYVEVRGNRLVRRQNWEYLIPVLYDAGIDVHALAGDPTWALKSNHRAPQRVLSAVIAFNDSKEQRRRFAGIKFDIEPHTMDADYAVRDLRRRGYEYTDDDAAQWDRHVGYRIDVFDEMIELYTDLAARAQREGLLIGADVPFWWDMVDWRRAFDENRQPDDPENVVTPGFNAEVRPKGRKIPIPATYLLIESLDSIGVMAYRDTVYEQAELVAWSRWGRTNSDNPQGAVVGGIVPHGTRPLHYAEIHNRKVSRGDLDNTRRAARIFIGVETRPVGPGVPSQATFGDDSYNDLLLAICRARAEFQYYDSFEGMAFHSYDHLKKLREKPGLLSESDAARRCTVWARHAGSVDR